MDQFCRTCPDRGTEICKIPPTSVRLGRTIRLLGAEAVQKLKDVADTTMRGAPGGKDRSMIEAEANMWDDTARIKACIYLHQNANS